MNKNEKKIDRFLEWNRKKFVRLAQIGFIMLILGLLLSSIISVLFSFDYGEFYNEVHNGLRVFKIISISLFLFGVLFFILSMFTIALNDEDMHIYLRVALIISIGLIIAIPLYSGYGI